MFPLLRFIEELSGQARGMLRAACSSYAGMAVAGSDDGRVSVIESGAIELRQSSLSFLEIQAQSVLKQDLGF